MLAVEIHCVAEAIGTKTSWKTLWDFGSLGTRTCLVKRKIQEIRTALTRK